MNDFFRSLPRQAKQAIALAFDIGATWASLWVAFSLRLDTYFWPAGQQWWPFAVAPLIATPIFVRLGLYRAVIRYTGLSALKAIAKAAFIYGSIFSIFIFVISWDNVPRSIGILQPILYLLLIAISRALVRFWLNAQHRSATPLASERLLIYGAGEAGIQIAHALNHSRQYKIIGFLDDDASLQGKTINDWLIYKPSQLDSVISRNAVNGILLALPSISKSRRFEILESLREKALHVRSLPSLSEMASASISLTDIQELDVDDLLGRTAIAPNQDLMAKNITGKVVLVTGAGGSIGGELCRQILTQKPSILLLLDHSEYGLYAIHQTLLVRQRTQEQYQTQIIPLLASVRDAARLALIFNTWKPHTVYHAAAYKHVPMVEHNVAEGVATNVMGTLYTAQVAAQFGCSHFVLISTDKAVRPANIMGASKRMAELILQALSVEEHKKNPATLFTMVRFGNVLDSSGSVVPLFRRQIKDGGPITLTHADVTRYFMTIPEAAQLVIQAAAMAKGGEVFVLDMGEPVKIASLAKRMVELSGLTIRDATHPSGDIEIQITGLRPGEKLYEELLIGNNPLPSQHVKIMQACENHLSWDELKIQLEALASDLANNNVSRIKMRLAHTVMGYNQDSPTVDWLTNTIPV
jgi:FlaA1/EpsC-like NDP-sugar epimerase